MAEVIVHPLDATVYPLTGTVYPLNVTVYPLNVRTPQAAKEREAAAAKDIAAQVGDGRLIL